MGMPAKKNAHYGSGMMRKPPGVSANDLWKREVSRRKSAMRKRQAEKKQAAATQDVLARKGLLLVSGAAMGAHSAIPREAPMKLLLLLSTSTLSSS